MTSRAPKRDASQWFWGPCSLLTWNMIGNSRRTGRGMLTAMPTSANDEAKGMHGCDKVLVPNHCPVLHNSLVQYFFWWVRVLQPPNQVYLFKVVQGVKCQMGLIVSGWVDREPGLKGRSTLGTSSLQQGASKAAAAAAAPTTGAATRMSHMMHWCHGNDIQTLHQWHAVVTVLSGLCCVNNRLWMQS